jgi:F420-dependent oxidoreductase-like protein
VGVFSPAASIDGLVADLKTASDAALESVWVPQVFTIDALTALAAAGREVPGIDVGTSVIPTYPRHPSALALQALTAQQAVDNRLILGIGLSHKMVVENMWGFSFDRPGRHMREYLSILMPLLHDRSVAFEGETLKTMGQAQIQGDVKAPPVVVAALAPQMLAIAGKLADGTITWMTGVKTIGSHIAPRINKAAANAGRPSPRVVVMLPVSVTDDEPQARERAANAFVIYGQLPSYRAMLDREGAEGPADVAIIGDAGFVRGEIEKLFEAGATDFVGITYANREKTLETLSGIARG